MKFNIYLVVQREITCRIQALEVKMTSEEEVVLLQEELEAARRELSRCQAECSGTKRLLSRKVGSKKVYCCCQETCDATQ